MCSEDEGIGLFNPNFFVSPQERRRVDTLPLCCGKSSSFEIDARQHAERLQV